MAIGIVAVLMLGAAYAVRSSTLTLTTIYPAPSGVYKALITTGGTTTSPLNTLLVRNAGVLGIGSSNPYSEVDINSGSSGTNTSGISMFTNQYESTKNWGTAIFKDDIGDGIPMIVQTQDGSTWYESARFDHGQASGHPSFQTQGATNLAVGGGNVGIATASPSQTLEVNGNAQIDQDLILSAASNSGGGTWQVGSVGWGGTVAGADSVTGIIYTGTSGSQLFTLSSDPGQASFELDGSIFVGDGAPAYNPLSLNAASDGYLAVNNGAEVGGALYVNGSASVGGTLTAGGTVTASDYYFSSDERLKTAIRPIAHALDRLLAIRGVSFQWKKNGKPDLGVMAQNVEKVFPELVTKDKKGFESAEYGNLIAPMIEAMRELKAQMDDLKGQVRELRVENERLRRLSRH